MGSEMKDLKTSNAEKDTRSADLEREVMVLKSKLHQGESLADLHSKDMAEIRDLQNQIQRLQQDLAGTKNTLVKSESENASLKGELASANDLLREANGNISSLQ